MEKIDKKDKRFIIGMTLIILSILASVLLTGCGDFCEKAPKILYTYKVEVVYDNGDSEILEFSEPQHDKIYLYNGDLRSSNNYSYKAVASSVRKYTVLEHSEEVIK